MFYVKKPNNKLLRFSKANSKLKKLEKIVNKKVYSFDMLSGINCTYAKNCLAKVIIKKGKRKLIRGPHSEFTCYSAQAESSYTNVYNLRKHNTDLIHSLTNKKDIVDLIQKSLPKKAEIIRIHSAADFKTQIYFDAWLEVCKNNPNIEFYAYTKSLPFWVNRLKEIPPNLSLSASYGGYRDDLIEKYNLKSARVVYSEQEAADLGLEIDRNDFHCYSKTKGSFALEIHSQGAQNSLQAKIFAQKRIAGKLKNI